MRAGDRSRCAVCGGRIVLIHDPWVISLRSGIWVHSGSLRRLFSTHPAEGPTDRGSHP